MKLRSTDLSGRSTLRVATWNTKQGVAPRSTDNELWRWVTEVIAPDLIVLTESKPPRDNVTKDWSFVYDETGIDGRRRWGTIVAGRNLRLTRTTFPRRKTNVEAARPNGAATFSVDVGDEEGHVLRLVGHYAVMYDEQNGFDSLDRLLNEVGDVTRHHGSRRTIVAGDFNLWPEDVEPEFHQLGMVTSTSLRRSFPSLSGQYGDSRIWTHKNGKKEGNGKPQELDYIFLSKDLATQVSATYGGVGDFPDAWELSDHAPVVVDLKLT